MPPCAGAGAGGRSGADCNAGATAMLPVHMPLTAPLRDLTLPARYFRKHAPGLRNVKTLHAGLIKHARAQSLFVIAFESLARSLFLKSTSFINTQLPSSSVSTGAADAALPVGATATLVTGAAVEAAVVTGAAVITGEVVAGVPAVVGTMIALVAGAAVMMAVVTAAAAVVPGAVEAGAVALTATMLQVALMALFSTFWPALSSLRKHFFQA